MITLEDDEGRIFTTFFVLFIFYGVPRYFSLAVLRQLCSMFPTTHFMVGKIVLVGDFFATAYSDQMNPERLILMFKGDSKLSAHIYIIILNTR